jgi:hypothetical protein
MRRILNQAANAAVKHEGSIFEIVYRRLIARLGHNGVRYEERGPASLRWHGSSANGTLCVPGGAEKDDYRRELHPHHQAEHRGKPAVDGSIVHLADVNSK